MKKIFAITITLFLSLSMNAQEESDSTNFQDTTYTIEWGNKTIVIMKNDDNKTEVKTSQKAKVNGLNSQRHNHFAGIDFGVNGFVNDAMSVDLRNDEKFMDQNYWGSWFLAINFVDSYIPIAKEKFGLTIGMGVEFNKYKLSRDFTVVNLSDSTFGIRDSSINIEKNLFKSTFINLPIMFETNLGKDADHSFHLMAGAMVSYRLGSKTKQIFVTDGEEYKVKSRGDYNLNDWRVSLVGRIGYKNFTIFASYSLTSFFEDNRGPELYPFSVGVSLVHF